MKRAHAFVLGVWVALLAADRIDLAGGAAGFVFTPFLALTPIVIVSEWVRRSMAHSRVTLATGSLHYAAAATALLAVVWASVMLAEAGITSVSRAVLLTAEVVGSLIVVVLAADRKDFMATLGRASVVGLVLHAVASLAALGAAVGMLPETLSVGSVDVSLETFVYTGVIPRLSGLVADPTRAGWAVLVMAAFAARGERRPMLRRAALVLATLMILATLSRSAVLAAAAVLAMEALTRRRLHLPTGPLAVATGIAAVVGVAFFLVPTTSVSPSNALDPLAGRFSATEASASEHVMLLSRGLEEATASPRRLALGLGYGNAFLVLQDRFPGNPYGNFHSLYVATLAESGIVALVLVTLLLAGPLTRGGPWRSLVAGAAVLNVFYQTNAEPSFWLVLALAWTFSEIRGTRPPPTG